MSIIPLIINKTEYNPSIPPAASSNDNALARFDGTTGGLIQNSAATVDDFGILTAFRFIANGAGGVASNSAFGYATLNTNSSGAYNTASGYATLYANTTGNSNTGTGYGALYTNTNSSNNTANGYMALRLTNGGGNNTGAGYAALFSNTTGSSNTALGYRAGYNLDTGSNNTILGALEGTAGMANTMLFGAGATERFRVDSSGRMGINDQAPTTQLSVAAGAEDGVATTYTASVGSTKKPLKVTNDSGLVTFEIGGNKTASEGVLSLRAPTGQGSGRSE